MEEKKKSLFILGFPQKGTSGWLNNRIRTLFSEGFICLHMFYTTQRKVLSFVIDLALCGTFTFLPGGKPFCFARGAGSEAPRGVCWLVRLLRLEMQSHRGLIVTPSCSLQSWISILSVVFQLHSSLRQTCLVVALSASYNLRHAEGKMLGSHIAKSLLGAWLDSCTVPSLQPCIPWHVLLHQYYRVKVR